MGATDGGRRDPRGRLERESFDRLLDWLDGDRDRAAAAYERIREKLTRFFDWRGAFEAEDLADRTIDRVSRKLSEPGMREGTDATAFFYGVARNILKEHRTEGARRFSALREMSQTRSEAGAEGGAEAVVPLFEIEDAGAPLAARLSCLDRCLAGLSADERELILAYYQGEKGEKIRNRRGLADRLGIPMNALWIRSHRVRVRLEACIGSCVDELAAKGAKGKSGDSH
jgi:DNA-directed RNA polymerase specialized sigma24 family protein